MSTSQEARPAASGFEFAAAGAIMVADDGSAGRKVGLGLELAPLRRRRPREGRRPAADGGLPRRPHQGPRRTPLVRPGPPLAPWAPPSGRPPAAEARLVGETVSYGGADLFVLDVEAEFEGQPQAAEELCRRVREAVGAGHPLYYSSFAIPRYHRSFPYAAFDKHCHGAAPQVY